MKKILFVFAFFLFFMGFQVSGICASKVDDHYFKDTQDPDLTKQEKIALEMATKWAEGNTVSPAQGPDGSVMYLFGASRPSIVCAVLQVTDVMLEPGELVNNINCGDTVRWLIEPAVTGTGISQVQHLIIKPMDVGLETSLVVSTNRRTYHFELKSTRSKYLPSVKFCYPDSVLNKWNFIKRQEVKEQRENTIPETGEYLGDLDFSYEVKGTADWKPIRVYNDGIKTIIQMPSAMINSEAPVLMLIRERGWFKSDETVLVNYRLQRDRYIVDAVFDTAILISGVGGDQEKVEIRRIK